METDTVTPSSLITLTKWCLKMNDWQLSKLLGVGYGRLMAWEAARGEPAEDIIRRLKELLSHGYKGR